MATESTQHSTIHCIFLWKKFPRISGISAEFFLGFEDTNVLSGSFDKVDEIDMLCKDSLGGDGDTFKRRTKRSTQLGTHRTAFSNGVWDRIYTQDMTELVPVVDVVLIGPV